MKRILFLTLFCALVLPSVGFAGSCLPVMCDTQKYDTDELLTEDGITGDVADSNFYSKLCYVCSKAYESSKCNNTDSVVIANDDGQHFVFQCVNGKKWAQVNEMQLGVCADSPLSQMDGYIENAFLSEIRQGQTNRGSTSVNITQTGRYNALCRYRKCMNGYEAVNGNLCVKETAEVVEKIETETEQPGATTGAQSGDTLNQTEKCIRSRCGGLTGNEHSQCITCCYVPASVAVWNSDERMCKCVDNQKTFNPSTLQCETSSATAQQPTGAFTCDANVLQQITSYTTQYADNASITTQINNILVYCSGDAPNQIVFNNMYNQLMVLINQVNTDSANAALNARITVSRTNISNAIKSINDASATLDVSKWRNTEGNFNTSRLLSDSIAGVVLGTAGGLITSHVVKQGQIENGFEDLQCTVGGQVVANWNDQFRVGIQ